MRIAILTRVRPDPQGDAEERRRHAVLSEIAALGHDLLVLSRWTGRPIDDPQLGRRARVIYPFRRFAAWEWPRAWASLYEFDPEVLHCLLDEEAAWWSAERVAPSSADFVNMVREQMRERRTWPLETLQTRVPALLSLGPTLSAESTVATSPTTLHTLALNRLWRSRLKLDPREVWISLGYQGVETNWLSRPAPTARLHEAETHDSQESKSDERDLSAPTARTLHFLTTPDEMLALTESRELDHLLGVLTFNPDLHLACSLHRRELPPPARARWVFWEQLRDRHAQALGARLQLSATEGTWPGSVLMASAEPLRASPEIRARHLRLLRQVHSVWTTASAADDVRREMRRAGLLARVHAIRDLDWPQALVTATGASADGVDESAATQAQVSPADRGGNQISRLYAWLAHPHAHEASAPVDETR
ncbi:MAG TPA: hypothetical protein PLZ57_09405 [Pseudobdellovibrionaceae bacterium]|nr:hypothetical protein [Pseudobdellovibrionaceae bacterium]